MSAIEELAALGVNTTISDGSAPKNRGQVMAGLKGAVKNPKATSHSREQAAQKLLAMILEDQAAAAAATDQTATLG